MVFNFMGGGKLSQVVPNLLVKNEKLSVLNLRYLASLRHYQTGIFALLEQCYYGVSTGTFHKFLRGMALSPLNTFTVK